MKDLTDAVKEWVRQKGADLVGISSCDRLQEAPPGHRPQDLLPGAKSIISFGLNALEGTFYTPIFQIYQLDYALLRHNSNQIAYQTARFLEGHGFYGLMIPGTLPVDMVGKRGMFGEFSHRHAAMAAGLGEIGVNQLLLTKEFGPRVWLGSIITTAPLEADTAWEGRLCLGEECLLCVTACPAHALQADGFFDKDRCAKDNAHRLNLSGVLRHLKNILAEEDREKRNRIIFGPTTWELYQSLALGMIPGCSQCIAVCPIGKRCR